MLNGLDLFSGYGGISIALAEWVRPIAYCEIDPYCQGVLLSQFANGRLPNAPIWDDIRTLTFHGATSFVDILYGGFPCQDISIAGHGEGLEGKRSRLFFEIVRLAKEIKPKFIFLENVPAITSRGGLQVVREIAEIGYDCRHDIFSAEEEGAPHKRERWFLLAHAEGQSYGQHNHGSLERPPSEPRESAGGKAVSSDSSCFGVQEGWGVGGVQERQSEALVCSLQSYWEKTEPPLCGVDDGPPYRVDRIRALGNGVVPQQAKKAFKMLMGLP